MGSASPARIVIVDGANTVYRAFFAIPHLRAPDGTPTNAVYGFANMLNKVIREEAPDAIAVVFDARGDTFRHALYPEYKAHREAQPEDLSAQLPLVRELVAAHGIPMLEVPEYEADDVIATLVDRSPADARITIVSTDKDLMQLVSDRVCLLDTMKDRRFGPAEVEARFGVPPERVLDLRALVGDPSDNIPGVKGIGEKGAAALLSEWGDLENLLAHADEVGKKRARSALAEGAEDARLSKRLATLERQVPLPAGAADLPRAEPDPAALRSLYERLGFQRLLDALVEAEGGAPARETRACDVRIVADAAALDALVRELATLPQVPLLAVFGRGGPMSASFVGLAVALADARAAYVPLSGSDAGGLEPADAAERLRHLLGDPGRVAWVAADAKPLLVAFGELGVELAPAHFDVGLAGLLVDPSGASGVAALASQHLDRAVPGFEESFGRGAKARPAESLPVEEIAAWAGAQVCAAGALVSVLRKRLEVDGLAKLYEEVELPLTRVLAHMERAGVRVDEAFLVRLSAEYESELARIEGEIYRLAGETFLISSPKQLQQVLFDKLKLPVIRKTKTGYSTDEGVLEQLSAHHELPARILAYRRLAKLRSTYVEALPPLVNPRTGRIHPTFHQLGAATGRLSASDPNVQNIPIRSEAGIRIREAFVPAEGRVLLSADYSQVELRILAHYSQDESLIEAFRRGEDIHRRTAAEVAGLPPDEIDADRRARAKAVNFGIIYGLSAFGLANQLGIASAEAQETIDAYFARYRGVRRFLDGTIAAARERGYVTTLLGRRRRLPDLRSRNRTLRNAAERMAVNTVIQGTAADLIKKAMVELHVALPDAGASARMILQVHDELVLELDEDEVPAVAICVRERMENVLPLRVPLVVEVGVGRSWREAH